MQYTNRELMIALLLEGSEDMKNTLKKALELERLIDDGGASEEAMIHYNIQCPYYNDKVCILKEDEEPNRNTCVQCKVEWLDEEVEE